MKKILSLLLAMMMSFTMMVMPVTADRDDVESFVTRLYDIALDRAPDKAGLEGWTEDLLTNTHCGVSVAFGFVYSPEFQNAGYDNATYVEKMYNMLLGRPADADGKAYWVDMLNNGVDKEMIFYGFANSQEFFNLCESYGIVAGHYLMGVGMDTNARINSFVSELYNVCLSRPGDIAGQAYWVENLFTGATSGTAAVYGFMYSQEFLNLNTTNEEYITALYRVFLNRNPVDSELQAWKEQLVNSSKSREDVFNGFSGSIEFNGLCSYIGIEVGNFILEGSTFTPNHNNPVVTSTPASTSAPTSAPTTPAAPNNALITLSGNRKDVTKITKNCYAESGRIRVFFCDGCEVYGDTLDYFNEVLINIEAFSGLTFMGGEYIDSPTLVGNEFVKDYYGKMYEGYDFDDGKLNILIVPESSAWPFSCQNVVVLNPIDLKFEAELSWAPVHEMAHSVQLTNSLDLGSILTEGYATLITNYIVSYTDLVNMGSETSLDYNYEYYPVILNKDTAESVFLAPKEDGWDNYLYGYRLANYLNITKGQFAFNDLSKRAYEMFGPELPEGQLSSEQAAALLKDVYGKDFFTDFGDFFLWPSSIQRFKPYYDESKYRITLEGNSDLVTIDKYCFAENESVRVFFYPGVKVSGDYLTYASKVLNTIEAELGLNLMDCKYVDRNDVEMSSFMSAVYGDEFNIPINLDDGKLNIFVARDDEWGPCSLSNCVIVNEMDMDTSDIYNYTLAHEAIHSVQLTNGNNIGHVMIEGMATAVSYYVVQDCDAIPVSKDHIDMQYEYYEQEITAANAEALFRAEKEDGWEDYLYGYRFCSFLISKYGIYAFNNYFAAVKDYEFGENHWLTNSESADLVIKVTGNKNIFVEFAEWINLPENASRFSY